MALLETKLAEKQAFDTRDTHKCYCPMHLSYLNDTPFGYWHITTGGMRDSDHEVNYHPYLHNLGGCCTGLGHDLISKNNVLIIHSSPVDGVVVMQKDANGLVSLPLDHRMGRLQVDASDELWRQPTVNAGNTASALPPALTSEAGVSSDTAPHRLVAVNSTVINFSRQADISRDAELRKLQVWHMAEPHPPVV